MHVHVYMIRTCIAVCLYLDPAPVAALNDSSVGVVHVACGHSHSLALTADGRLFVWGSNEHGQLGLSSASLTHLGHPRSVTLHDYNMNMYMYMLLYMRIHMHVVVHVHCTLHKITMYSAYMYIHCTCIAIQYAMLYMYIHVCKPCKL